MSPRPGRIRLDRSHHPNSVRVATDEGIEMTLIEEPAPAAAGAMRLQGKTAAVTGGGAGIGAAICRRLAAEGAAVAALDIALPSAQRTVDALGGGLAVVAAVRDSAAADPAVAHRQRELAPPPNLGHKTRPAGVD